MPVYIQLDVEGEKIKGKEMGIINNIICQNLLRNKVKGLGALRILRRNLTQRRGGGTFPPHFVGNIGQLLTNTSVWDDYVCGIVWGKQEEHTRGSQKKE